MEPHAKFRNLAEMRSQEATVQGGHSHALLGNLQGCPSSVWLSTAQHTDLYSHRAGNTLYPHNPELKVDCIKNIRKKSPQVSKTQAALVKTERQPHKDLIDSK